MFLTNLLVNNNPLNLVNEMCLVQRIRQLVRKWDHSHVKGDI